MIIQGTEQQMGWQAAYHAASMSRCSGERGQSRRAPQPEVHGGLVAHVMHDLKDAPPFSTPRRTSGL